MPRRRRARRIKVKAERLVRVLGLPPFTRIRYILADFDDNGFATVVELEIDGEEQTEPKKRRARREVEETDQQGEESKDESSDSPASSSLFEEGSK